MAQASETGFVAFDGDRCVASGDLREVARSAKLILDRRPDAPLLIFDRATGATIELDFRGAVEDVLARLPDAAEGAAEEMSSADPAMSRGPGRPKLGVVAREITLLPRHWEWLAHSARRTARPKSPGSPPEASAASSSQPAS